MGAPPHELQLDVGMEKFDDGIPQEEQPSGPMLAGAPQPEQPLLPIGMPSKLMPPDMNSPSDVQNGQLSEPLWSCLELLCFLQPHSFFSKIFLIGLGLTGL